MRLALELTTAKPDEVPTAGHRGAPFCICDVLDPVVPPEKRHEICERTRARAVAYFLASTFGAAS